jgi:acyl-ACP thioesterase
MPLNEAEFAVFAETAAGRRVTARLRHPAPAEDATGSPWTFRASERDVADHVNNAAYWTPLEDELLSNGTPEPAQLEAEIEYRTPAQPGPKTILADGAHRWIVGHDGEVHASVRAAQLNLSR